MNARDLISATDDQLVAIGWIRRELFPEIPRATRELFLAVEVAADFWAARFLGVIPEHWTRGGGGAPSGATTTKSQSNMSRRQRKNRKLFSYNAGLRGVNWVRISERRDSSWIQIEARPGGKRIKGVLAVAGFPLESRDPESRKIARAVADRTAERMHAAIQQAQEMVIASGDKSPVAIQALLEAAASEDMLRALPRVPERTHPSQPTLEASKADDLHDLGAKEVPANRRTFREAFRRAKEGCTRRVATSSAVRDFIDAVGPDRLVNSLANDDYARHLRAIQQQKKWAISTATKAQGSLGTFLKYVRKDLGWACEDVPSEIKFDEATGGATGKPYYSEEEYTAILERGSEVEINLNPGVSRQMVAACAIGYAVAARFNATMSLELANITRGPFPEDGIDSPDVFRLGWRPETLKGGVKVHGPHMKFNHLLKVTHPREFEILERYLEERRAMPAKAGAGLFPRVFDLKEPAGTTTLNYLNEVEAGCGIEKVDGRAFHGFKRKRVCDCDTVEELHELAPVAFTEFETLRKDYHQFKGVLSNNAALDSARKTLGRKGPVSPDGAPGAPGGTTDERE